jgi:HlyD family secretion protein
MKIWKFMGIPFVVLILILAGCNQSKAQPSTPSQTVTVTRGDLTVKVNGSGKIAVANDANLSFGSGGKLALLNIKEGDLVKKGDILAKLDTATLEVSLAQSKVGLDQVQLAQSQAQTALTAAQFSLDAAQTVSNIKDQITTLQWNIKAAQVNLAQALATGDTASTGFLNQYIASNQMEILKQQKQLSLLLSKDEYTQEQIPTGMTLSTYYMYIAGQQYDRLMVQEVRMRQQAVETAQKALDQIKDNIIQAQKNMDNIQKQINDATISAPFDGIIAKLTVKKGDIIPAPTVSPQVIAYLADIDMLEVDVNVDEMDIVNVHTGQKAVIMVDALPGTKLDGQVDTIATLPNAQAAAAGATAYIAKVDFTVPRGTVIKAGMNASVDIITSEYKNVLLLSSQALKKDNQGKFYVETPNNKQQPVVTGAGNDSLTQIVSGLNDGDTVMAVQAGKWSLPKK